MKFLKSERRKVHEDVVMQTRTIIFVNTYSVCLLEKNKISKEYATFYPLKSVQNVNNI